MLTKEELQGGRGAHLDKTGKDAQGRNPGGFVDRFVRDKYIEQHSSLPSDVAAGVKGNEKGNGGGWGRIFGMGCKNSDKCPSGHPATDTVHGVRVGFPGGPCRIVLVPATGHAAEAARQYDAALAASSALSAAQKDGAAAGAVHAGDRADRAAADLTAVGKKKRARAAVAELVAVHGSDYVMEGAQEECGEACTMAVIKKRRAERAGVLDGDIVITVVQKSTFADVSKCIDDIAASDPMMTDAIV